MVKKISIKTKFGWISAFEKKGRIYRIRFGKLHKQNNSKNLVLFKKNLFKYLNKKSKTIKASYDILGNKTQRKVLINRITIIVFPLVNICFNII